MNILMERSKMSTKNSNNHQVAQGNTLPMLLANPEKWLYDTLPAGTEVSFCLSYADLELQVRSSSRAKNPLFGKALIYLPYSYTLKNDENKYLLVAFEVSGVEVNSLLKGVMPEFVANQQKIITANGFTQVRLFVKETD